MSIKQNSFTQEEIENNLEGKFEKLIDNAPVGMYLIQDGIFNYCNTKLAQILGYEKNEIVNKKSIKELTFAGDWHRTEEIFLRFQSSDLESNRDSVRVIRKDKSIIIADIYGAKTSLNGRMAVIGTLVDVTEEKNNREQLNILAHVIKSAGECVTITDLDHRIFYVNETLCKTFGYTADELLGKYVGIFHDGCVKPQEFQRIIKATYETGWKGEILSRRKDGSIFPILLTTTLVYDINKKPLAVVGFSQDISNQNKIIEDLDKSERKLRTLIERMPDGLVYLKIICNNNGQPTDFEIVQVNDSFKKLLNISTENLIGKTLSSQLQHIHDTNFNLIERFGEVFMKRAEEKFEVYSMMMNKYYSISAYCPEENHIVAIVKDITFKKNAEEEALKSRHMLRTILDNIPQRVFWKDKESVFQGCNINFAKDLGFENPDEIIGKTDFDVNYEKLAEEFISRDQYVMNNDHSLSIDYEKHSRPDGTPIWIRSNKFPLKDKNNNVFGIVGTYEDVSKQRTIEENVRKLSQAVEQSPASILITDLTGKIEYVNPKFTRLTGYTFEEVKGKNTKILKSGEMSAEVYQDMWQTISSGQEWQGEFHNKKKNGELYWERASISPIKDNNGVITNYLAVKEDITKRNRVEEELKHSFSLLEGTLESTIDGILVVDQNGKIQRFNNKFLDLWRIPESIIQTRNDYAALDFVLGQLKYPDQFLNKVKDLYKDIMAESKDLLEFVDGRVFERYSRPQLIGNKVVGRVWSFRDITDKKIAEESLTESEEKFRTLFETSIEGILFADINEKNNLVNQRMAEMTGYSVSELMSMNFQQLIPPDELESHFLKIESRKKGDSEIYERKLVRKDGTIIWTLVSAAPTFNKAGEYTGSFGVFTDITEQKKMLEELIAAKEKAEEINRLKSIFLANISHELRTPLVGILGYAETLYNEIENPEFKEMAYILFKSGTRLKETLNLILDLSNIEADHLTINLSQLNLTKIVREKLKQFHSFAEEKGLNLQMILGDEDLEINADERILSQLLENLLANAIKYTTKGNVTVSIVKIFKNDKKYAEIKIKDTGIGISSQSAQLIFEPFRQASEGVSRTFEGIGLGLTVAKKFIEMMGGEISVESEVGKGSEFTVKFPIYSDSDISFPKDLSHEKISNKQILHNYKFPSEVLLIEDDEPTANIVRFYLSETCKTAWACNAKTAISLAKKKNYSAILVDINLGFGMNGIEAINEIKKIKGYSSIPIIAVTAYALYGDREKFLNQGCTHYISKPFGKNDIVALMDKVLESKE